ncbi:MAG: ferritin family protein, partial [Planctomycetota bacterium]
MAEFESDGEILELAIAREEDANRFYLILAERVKSAEMRQVFEELAGEELEHKARLELEIIKTGKVATATVRLGELEGDDDMDVALTELDMDYKDMLIMAMQKE